MQCTGKHVRWVQTQRSSLLLPKILTLASTGLKEVLLTATLTCSIVLLLICCRDSHRQNA